MNGKYKLIFTSIVLVIFIIILITGFIYFFALKSPPHGQALNKLITNASQLHQETKKENLPKPIEEMFQGLKGDSLSDKEKYDKLLEIRRYFSFIYNETYSPSLREFIENDMRKYAKDYYSNLFNPEDFTQTCTDPTCGEKIDNELNDIIKILNKSGIPDDEVEVIIYNLKLSSYLPSNEIESKTYGYSLTVFQLEEFGTKEASDAAKLVKDYFVNKYGNDLYELTTNFK